MREDAVPAHLHGQSLSMVWILLENAVGHFDGLLMLFGLIKLNKRFEGGGVLAPQWLRHCVGIVAKRAKLGELGG